VPVTASSMPVKMNFFILLRGVRNAVCSPRYSDTVFPFTHIATRIQEPGLTLKNCKEVGYGRISNMPIIGNIEVVAAGIY
jgi:hypothetical protein